MSIIRSAGFALALAASTAASAQQTVPIMATPVQSVSAPPAAGGGILVERDTLIRLMVLNEVSSRTTQPGERFVLRVDEAVVVGGATIIPVGAKAWGEVLSADKSGAVGKAGTLAVKLLHVDVGGNQLPISGESQAKGEKGTKQVVLGALGLGLLAPLALLAPGNNAKLKAGDIFNAYLSGDMLFDPATSTFTPVEGVAAPALAVEVR